MEIFRQNKIWFVIFTEHVFQFLKIAKILHKVKLPAKNITNVHLVKITQNYL